MNDNLVGGTLLVMIFIYLFYLRKPQIDNEKTKNLYDNYL